MLGDIDIQDRQVKRGDAVVTVGPAVLFQGFADDGSATCSATREVSGPALPCVAPYLRPVEAENPKAHCHVRRLLQDFGKPAQIDLSHAVSLPLARRNALLRLGSLMGVEPTAPTAPAVVAVVVACCPGPWFDETLESLAVQDYPALSVLVVAVGDDGDLAERVALVLPEAHLAQAPEGAGFAEAANLGVARVDGAPHVLVCHDDVALAPDAVRLLLEEAYRSNAGLTCPKCVLWDAPDRLQSVGMGADHLGVVHALVSPGDLDQGQHDAARGVFVAPSGVVLVRTDLWRALGGFGDGDGGPGEDLDLSWRAQLAGARVVVAPQAVARHLEATSAGLRRSRSRTSGRHGAAGAEEAERESRKLRDQHRLRTLWTCYSIPLLVLVAPVVVAFSLAEPVWSAVHRRSRRDVVLPAAALVGSFRHPRQLWAARRNAQGLRSVSDFVLWKSQSRGSARLRSMARRRMEKGYELAWAAKKAATTATTAHATPAATALAKGTHEPVPLGWKWKASTAAVVAILLIIGSRNVLAETLPLAGQLPQVGGGVGAWWHAWWSGPGTAGLAGSSFAPPGLLFMGLLGALVFGSASIAVHLLVLVPLFLGPLGAYVAARRFGSERGQLVAMALYAAVPVPYNAVSQGDWAGLVSYAVAPWLLGGLCRLGGRAPYPSLRWEAAWPRYVALGLVLAVAGSFAPGLLLLVPVLGAALAVGSLLAGRGQGGTRLLAMSAVVAAVAFAALAPWSVSALRSWPALVGAQPGTVHPLGLSQLLRLKSGPYGGGALGWALVVAAAMAALIGRSWRLAWAGRMWMVALACLGLAWAGSRGWFPSPAPELLLAPAGAALVLAVALGVASVEVDLAGYRFGWRQFAPALGALATLAAALPFVSWVGSGQWDLTASGAGAAYAYPAASQAGDYRVLWLGASHDLPLAAQGTSEGLAFAASLDGLPSTSQLWAPNRPGQAVEVAQDLAWAGDGETTALGHLLAPLAIRYIVVPVGTRSVDAATAGMVDALDRQVDLVDVGIDPAYQVFENSAWLPMFSVLGGTGPADRPLLAVSTSTAWATARDLQQLDLHPVQTLVVGTSGRGVFTVRATSEAPPGTATAPRVIYGAVPAGTWNLTANGHQLAARPVALGATSWALPGGRQRVVISRASSAGQHAADVAMLVIWVVAISAAFSGMSRRRARQRDGKPGELARPAMVGEVPVG